MDQWLTFLLMTLCLLPVAVLGVTAWLLQKYWRQIFVYFVVPDPDEVDQKFAQITAQSPELNQEELLEKIIEMQARRCGTIGAIVNLASFVTLPVTIAVDFITALRIQARLIAYIGEVYDSVPEDREALGIQTALIMVGNANLSQIGSRLFGQFALKLLGPKLFVAVFPLLSGVAGYAVNYYVTKGTANLAIKWHQGELHPNMLKSTLESKAAPMIPEMITKVQRLPQMIPTAPAIQKSVAMSEIMSPEEVATYLCIPLAEVQTLLDEGQLRHKVIGSNQRVTRQALTEFLQS